MNIRSILKFTNVELWYDKSIGGNGMLLEKFKLDKKVCIVTGASQGLGVVFSEALAETGAELM